MSVAGASASPTDGRRPVDRDLAATASLAAFGIVVAIGFARVFTGWAFLVDLVVVVVVGHATSFALRRASVTGWIAAPLTALVLVWLVAWQQYAATFSRLLPTRGTWEVLRVELDLVREQFPTTSAPVIYGAGWAALAGVAMVVVVVLADTFAFRAEARGEALVPGGVLFVFIGGLGDDRSRVVLTASLVAAGVVAVVALRAYHDRRRRVELISARPAPGTGLAVVAATALVVALAAGVLGPRVPGASAEPLLDTSQRSGGVTTVDNPLVDIRSRLVNQSPVEVFRVDADTDSYWRLITLAEFDGQRFALPNRPLERIDGVVPRRPDAQLIRQDIVVTGLTGRMVPAAADPIQASPNDRIRWNPETSTLVVPDELVPGDRFTIVSASPRLQPSQLRSTASLQPPDPIYLGLPARFPSIVSTTARDVTAGAETTYDAALALQTWFREDGGFTYSTDVQAGHGSSAIEVFLRQRIGYCEQFAATFAAMARAVGIPTRVAVGYTAGIRGDDGVFSVLGRNAHAWPEVWFDGIGWVPFEPTPGRGAPGTEAYTNVAPAQDESPPEPGGADGDQVGPPVSTVVPPRGPDDALGPSLIPDVAEPGTSGGGGTSTRPPPSGTNRAPLLLVAAIAAAIAAPWVVRTIRRRFHPRAEPERAVLESWHRATAAASRAGVVGTASMTPAEWAEATATTLPMAARPMRALADTIDVVTFAPAGSVDLLAGSSLGTSLVTESRAWAHQVEAVADDRLSVGQRVARHFSTWN